MKPVKKLTLTGMILALTLSFLWVQAPADELQKKYIASSAKWVIHLDFKAMKKTRLWDAVYKKKNVKIHRKNERILEEVDFNVLEDLYSISIYGVDQGEKEAVVLINGNFNRDRILKRLKEKEKPEVSKYGPVKIYHWDDDYGAFVEDDLLVITQNRINMEYAIDVISGKKKGFRFSPLAKRLKEVPGNAILFALAGDLSKMIGKHHKAPVMINKSRMALFLAMEKNNDLKMSLKLHTESPEAARNLMQVGNGLLALARMSKEDMGGKEKLLNSIDIAVDKNVVSARMFIPAEFIMENIDKHH